jgi:hypothetical protein
MELDIDKIDQAALALGFSVRVRKCLLEAADVSRRVKRKPAAALASIDIYCHGK